MFTEEINKINNVSAETRNAVTRKSAQTLPNNPSAQGYSAEEIKRRFYQPILDAANSALSEIDRVVNEVNVALGQLDTNMDTFLERSLISEPYKVTLDEKTWKLNDENGLYELIITKEQHGIENHEEIGVDMFLLDGEGNYTAVNQFEILPNSTVRCFNENNGAGYVSIYTKREGYVWGDTVVDVNHVIGISKVGVSNNYEDLDNRPDFEIMYANEQMLAKIISGAQEVNKAVNAEKCDNAVYANSSGNAESANNAQSAVRATTDQYGVNISSGYCKQNGNYPDLRSGKSNFADNAKADEDGLNIKTNYAQQAGNYQSMTVGKATRASNADNADFATKASQDSNGANIANTYAIKTGNYPTMTVGKSAEADIAKQLENGARLGNNIVATTQGGSDNSDKLATTAFVKNALNSQPKTFVVLYNNPSNSSRDTSVTNINNFSLVHLSVRPMKNGTASAGSYDCGMFSLEELRAGVEVTQNELFGNSYGLRVIAQLSGTTITCSEPSNMGGRWSACVTKVVGINN